jgi:Na+/melibiose symporter-like transporter
MLLLGNITVTPLIIRSQAGYSKNMTNQKTNNNALGNNRLGLLDYIKITLIGFSFTALWSSLHGIILPMRLLAYVPETQKNTYLGLLTFTGLLLAIIVQPMAGAFSDATNSRWGRRRPYILWGTVLALILLPGIGLATTYVTVLVIYCLLQVCTNTAQASYQAFIPELVPDKSRGVASGVKSLLEVLGGVILVRITAYLMGQYSADVGESWMWIALGALGVVLFTALIITMVSVKESPSNNPTRPLLSTLYKSFKIDFKVHRDFGWFLLSRALLGIPGVVLQIFAIYFLMDVIGIPNPASAAGDLLVVVGVCLIAMVYPAGRLSDRVGRKPIIIIASIVGAIGTIVLFFSRNYMQVMISGGILGIANGALLSASWALATDLAIKGEEARYLGVTNLAMAGGSALARLIGPVIDFFNGISTNSGYKVMLLVCFLSFIAGAVFIAKIKQVEAAPK